MLPPSTSQPFQPGRQWAYEDSRREWRSGPESGPPRRRESSRGILTDAMTPRAARAMKAVSLMKSAAVGWSKVGKRPEKSIPASRVSSIHPLRRDVTVEGNRASGTATEQIATTQLQAPRPQSPQLVRGLSKMIAHAGA